MAFDFEKALDDIGRSQDAIAARRDTNARETRQRSELLSDRAVNRAQQLSDIAASEQRQVSSEGRQSKQRLADMKEAELLRAGANLRERGIKLPADFGWDDIDEKTLTANQDEARSVIGGFQDQRVALAKRRESVAKRMAQVASKGQTAGVAIKALQNALVDPAIRAQIPDKTLKALDTIIKTTKPDESAYVIQDAVAKASNEIQNNPFLHIGKGGKTAAGAFYEAFATGLAASGGQESQVQLASLADELKSARNDEDEVAKGLREAYIKYGRHLPENERKSLLDDQPDISSAGFDIDPSVIDLATKALAPSQQPAITPPVSAPAPPPSGVLAKAIGVGQEDSDVGIVPAIKSFSDTALAAGQNVASLPGRAYNYLWSGNTNKPYNDVFPDSTPGNVPPTTSSDLMSFAEDVADRTGKPVNPQIALQVKRDQYLSTNPNPVKETADPDEMGKIKLLGIQKYGGSEDNWGKFQQSLASTDPKVKKAATAVFNLLLDEIRGTNDIRAAMPPAANPTPSNAPIMDTLPPVPAY